MNDTTNAAKRPSGLRACADGLDANPDKDFAQKCMRHAADRMEDLERELAVTKQRNELENKLEKSKSYKNVMKRDNAGLRKQLTAVTEQRDRLAEAIMTHRAKAFPLTGKEFDQELWQVLQSLNQNETNPAAGSKKTNMENQNNSENQSAAMPCSPYPCRKTHDADWIPALFAPKDRKIMGFFEDIGWYPACWSEDKQMWCISYCAGVPDTNPEEPRWIQRLIYADYICWWREWPNQTHPRHSEENDKDLARRALDSE